MTFNWEVKGQSVLAGGVGRAVLGGEEVAQQRPRWGLAAWGTPGGPAGSSEGAQPMEGEPQGPGLQESVQRLKQG